MKRVTILNSHRTDLREFTETYREIPNGVELCGVSFGHEPIESASEEDIEQHRKNGSGLNWLESAASVLLHGGIIKRF